MDTMERTSGGGTLDLGAGAISPRHVTGARARRRRGMFAAVALVALLVGTGPAAFSSQTRVARAAVTAPAVPPGDAAYLPASTAMFASVNPSIGGVQGKYLQGLEAIFQSEPGFSSAVKSAAGAQGSHCLNMDNQVLSWLNGSITLAITDPSVFSSVSSTLPLTGTSSALSSATQGLAIVLAIKPATVHSILAQRKFDALPGILLHYRLGAAKAAGTYGGVNYYTLQISACGMKKSKSPTYGAIVGNEGVVTPTVKDLKQVIDVIQGKTKSLASTAGYQRLIATLPPSGLGYFYLNTPALVKAGSGVASTLSSTTGLTGTVPSAGRVDKEFGALGASIMAQANGLQIESVQLLNVAGKQQAAKVTPDKGATLLPTGTMFYLSIGDLQGVITSVLNTLKAASSAQDAKTYDQLTTSFSGVLNLLTGESAIGILPMTPKDAAALTAGNIGGLPLAALFGVKDPTAAGAVVSSLLSLAGGSSASSSQSVLKQTALANGGMEFANTAGYGYATMQQWLVASTAIKSVMTSIQATLSHPGDSLAASSTYLQAAAGLPKHSTATMYLDITSLRTLLEGVALGTMSKADKASYEQVRPLLLPMKAMEAGTSSQDNGKTLRTDLFVLIGK